MTPTKIGFTRESIITYIMSELVDDEIADRGEDETRKMLSEETNWELVNRVKEAGCFEDEEECGGIYEGAYPSHVVDFETVSDITGIPVSLEQYLQDKDLEAEDEVND